MKNDLVEGLNGTLCCSFGSLLLLTFIKIFANFYVDD